MKAFSLASAAALAALAASAQAEELAETAARFGARESVLSPALSPSGNRLLYIQPGSNAEEVIYVVDLAGGGAPKAITSMTEKLARLDECRWATEERIVCRIYATIENSAGTLLGFTRVIGMKSDGTDVTRLTPDETRMLGLLQDGGSWLSLDLTGDENKILMTRQFIKESAVNTRLFNDQEGLGVDAVDVTNGRRKTVEQPNRMAVGYLADGSGVVRIMAVSDTSASGYDGSDLRYLYRPAGSKKWEALSSVDQSGDVSRGFWPAAIDGTKNIAYGFDNVNGYQALFVAALDGSGKREQVLARSDVDVDGLLRIGRKRRVVGASYATERRTVQYFDSELDALASGLAKALPRTPIISFQDASEDENEILFVASSDDDPGTLYLYEKDVKRVSELLTMREPLAGREMATVKPVTYPAADGTQIPGYLTLPVGSGGKNLPAVVLPHGGPGARDEWGFDWLPQFLAARGYAVLQPNYRGSAGYGEAWYGRNGFKEWRTAISDVDDAGRWLVAQGIASPNKLGIVGWSYGGYAALQSQVLDPELFKAVVAIAPVTDLELLKEENRAYTNFAAYERFIGSGPHVAAGSPARHTDRFSSPVLLVHGTMDMNVSVAQSKLIRDRLKRDGKQVDYHEFEGLDHYLENSQARAIMLKRIGEFLDANLRR